MFTFSTPFTRITLAAAVSLALAGAASAQAVGGNTVVGGFAKNGGAVRAVDLNQGFTDDVFTAQKAKAANTAPRPGARLPSNLKTGIQNLSGTSLDNVRVHRNSSKPANIGARAYAKGAKIHIGPGQARHLPHEAWHVVNQNQGRVRPQLPNSNSLNLAREADALKDTRRTSKSIKSANTLRKANKSADFARRAKATRTVAKGAQTANVARHGNTARKTLKTANAARKVGKAALMGTGVGAVVGITAGLAGVDPVDLAVLKATNPAAYNAKMAALKKNPVKYMGDNIKNNTVKTAKDIGNATKKAGQAVGNASKKAAANVGKATKTAANKVGCGVGNIFKKKADKNKC